MSDPVVAHALAGAGRVTDRLAQLIACPSVGGDPACAAGMEDARRLLEGWLAEAGFANLARLTTADGSGQPALYADWLGAPGAPTLLVYGHYDVQPPEPIAPWQSPPFQATERAGRIYGRGASDDKGPVLVALAALAAFLAVEGALPVNVRIFLEGEEEVGSPSLPGILAQNRDLLAADAVLSADGARWRPDLCSVNVGARGSGGMELRLTTAAKDLHSGRYGGIVPNALHQMSRLIAGLHDADGRIAIPGIYDGVAAPTKAERAALAAIPFDEAATLADLGSTAQGEAGYTWLERLWLRPTLDVNGLWGGHTGAGGKTVIPCEAQAKLTMRLVPGQDPAAVRAALRAHLSAACPPGAKLEILSEDGWSPASAVPPDHPLLAAVETALTRTTGTAPVRVRIGATLPLSGLIRSALGIDTVMFSFATADEDFHAPNEFFRLSAIDEGLAAWIAALRAVGAQSPGDYARFRAAPE